MRTRVEGIASSGQRWAAEWEGEWPGYVGPPSQQRIDWIIAHTSVDRLGRLYLDGTRVTDYAELNRVFDERTTGGRDE